MFPSLRQANVLSFSAAIHERCEREKDEKLRTVIIRWAENPLDSAVEYGDGGFIGLRSLAASAAMEACESEANTDED